MIMKIFGSPFMSSPRIKTEINLLLGIIMFPLIPAIVGLDRFLIASRSLFLIENLQISHIFLVAQGMPSLDGQRVGPVES